MMIVLARRRRDARGPQARLHAAGTWLQKEACAMILRYCEIVMKTIGDVCTRPTHVYMIVRFHHNLRRRRGGRGDIVIKADEGVR